MNKVFESAKNIARQLGYDKRYVNADQVQAELEKLGYKSSDLGNAAGNVFRSKEWQKTGRFVVSARPTSHKRQIAVWEYTGAKPVPTKIAVDIETASPLPLQTSPFPILNPAVPLTQYSIKMKSADVKNWSTSWNKNLTFELGERLSRTVFTDLAVAQAEAAAQQKYMNDKYAGKGYEYAVFDQNGNPVPVVVPTKLYVIKFKSPYGRQDWSRSGNSSKVLLPTGNALSRMTTTSLEDARKEAAEQQEFMKSLDYQYAVFDAETDTIVPDPTATAIVAQPVATPAEAKPAVVLPKYVIKFRWAPGSMWHRSSNTAKTLGTSPARSLGIMQFETLSEAQREADAQAKSAGYEYAVFESDYNASSPVYVSGRAKYVIEYREGFGEWQRSYNTSKTLATPTTLGKYEFGSLSAAEAEARQQKIDMGYGYEYRATAVA